MHCWVLNNLFVIFTWDPPRVYRKACIAVGESLPITGSADTWPPKTYTKNQNKILYRACPLPRKRMEPHLRKSSDQCCVSGSEWIRIDFNRLDPDPDLGGQNWRTEAFFCSLDVLKEAYGSIKGDLDKKIGFVFSTEIVLEFLVIKPWMRIRNWIRIRIRIDLKWWISIRIDTSADPQHC